MRYTYDAVIERDQQGYAVHFPQFPDAFTFGATREEAIQRAAEVLTLSLVDRLEDGGDIPPQQRTAEVVSVSVDVTGSDVDRSKCLTMEQAAEELGVSPSRVSQLATSGKLTAVRIDGRRMVTIASVNARKANPPAPHRPRKGCASG